MEWNEIANDVKREREMRLIHDKFNLEKVSKRIWADFRFWCRCEQCDYSEYSFKRYCKEVGIKQKIPEFHIKRYIAEHYFGYIYTYDNQKQCYIAKKSVLMGLH